MSEIARKANGSAANGANSSPYTNLHLAALAFVYPPSPPNIAACPCEEHSAPQAHAAGQEKHIRVYRNEPSGYGYNSGRYQIRESRFNSAKGWHSPTDDLVADDAAEGSPVATIGWWEKTNSDEKSAAVFQTRVYYVAWDGKIQERTNRSYFSHETTKDDFDAELPNPDQLVPPAPGWKLTPIGTQCDVPAFPTTVLLATTKLAAVRCEDGSIHVFYQAKDESIRQLVFALGKGWISPDTASDAAIILEPGVAKAGTPLTAVAGGWSEKRVFAVDKTNKLLEVCSNNKDEWVAAPTPYTLHPSAMISAVASNFASAHFDLRIYTAAENDDLHELSFHRAGSGWASTHKGISSVEPEALPKVEKPLSAVAAVLVPGEWVTKVYFHPRRITVAEWDICAKDAAHAGITKLSDSAKKRRAIEEETRVKIALEQKRREEERKRKEEERKRKEEEERKRKEEEERKRKEKEEAERRQREEAEKKRKKEAELQRQKEEAKRKVRSSKNVQIGGQVVVEDPVKKEKLKKRVGCPNGFALRKINGGWVCDGGQHEISDADYDAIVGADD